MTIETPTGIHLGTWETGSEEWLAARRNGIGGSEISAVLGLSPFESRYSLWQRKRRAIPDTEVNAQMVWGNYAEPALLAWYHDLRRPIDPKPGTFRHCTRAWQIANPDGLTEDRVIEAKTAVQAWPWGEPGTGAVPPYYRCQSLWYLDVLGLDRCDVVASLGGVAPEVWTVKYDPDDATYLREAAKDFLDSIDTGAEPDIDGSEHTYEAVRHLNPQIKAKAEYYLDDETAETYQRANRDEKAAKEEKRRAAAVILRQMGTAQYAMHGRERVASRQTKQGGAPFLVVAREAA